MRETLFIIQKPQGKTSFDLSLKAKVEQYQQKKQQFIRMSYVVSTVILTLTQLAQHAYMLIP